MHREDLVWLVLFNHGEEGGREKEQLGGVGGPGISHKDVLMNAQEQESLGVLCRCGLLRSHT